jgi:trk system potassium uptake protein TrkA
VLQVVEVRYQAGGQFGSGFKGRRITGFGFDRDVIAEAGIEQASAFVAVSSGDNSNIVAARLVREKFGVPIVVARIYDPRRAEIYQRLGIPTVATVKWTTDQVMRFLIPEQVASDWKDPTEGVSLVTMILPPEWAGWPIAELEADGHRRVVAVTRTGQARIVTPDLILQEGDQVHLAVDNPGLDELRPMILAARRTQQDEAEEPARSDLSEEVRS